MIDMKNHNTMMINISSSLSYSKFDEVKDYPTTYDIWKKMKEIYGGDENVRRDKGEILRGQFDQMKMKEGEDITKYSERIKKCVSVIRASGGKI